MERKFLEAVNIVCMECHYLNEDTCERCPVRKTCKEKEIKIMKEIVKVYTDCLNADGRGDFVRCVDCGELSLIQLGGTVCGCESENLQWADEDHQECTIKELETMGYIIVEK